ncbi:hypothetical protein [Flaviaesturariibacter aridisoli]|uniref:MarR family transcriptional regulator n=1 Tax=Flaviaesturariibacter aridisoli TaxID=2545761 RepID=A0A4R4E151_9BACT|nr:hypothetical protein [Flaviaesturariibacter aridisoli]TCZ71023.1 hypothetical protein E0486_10390 [Flaviaesturariibacter aridisoli]
MELRPVAPVPVRALAPLPSEAALIRLLKRNGMGNVPNDGVWRAACLLLWAARNTGPITYAAIGERLRLSEDGVCKLIMSLRKRGLLERSGWQRLRVSDRTLQLLEAANGNP